MLNTENKHLKGIPAKFFEESNKADSCSECGMRMIHPSDGLYVCPNEKCQFTFRFYPESNKSVIVLNESKLKVKK